MRLDAKIHMLGVHRYCILTVDNARRKKNIVCTVKYANSGLFSLVSLQSHLHHYEKI